MQFCQTCDNKLYMRICSKPEGEAEHTEPNPQLVLYCKNCTYSTDTSTATDAMKPTDMKMYFDPCMYRSNYLKEHPLYYSTIVNEYTFDDPTLPVVDNGKMKCPNEECSGGQPILFMRYDDEDMRYLYLCKACRWCWRTAGFKKSEVLFKFGPVTSASAADDGPTCIACPTIVEDSEEGVVKAAE